MLSYFFRKAIKIKMLSGKMTTKLNFWALILTIAMIVALMTSCGKNVAVQGERGLPGADGKNGADGKDGKTPYIGENNNWWTGNVDSGISAVGKDGANGADGEPGKNGEPGENGVTPKFVFDDTSHILSVSYDDGKTWEGVIDFSAIFDADSGETGVTKGEDGVTPKLKIEDDYWMVSYDNGLTWESLGSKASGTDGAPGSPGPQGAEGVTPRLRINSDTDVWEVSYDNGGSWVSLNVTSKGGDGITPEIRINADTCTWEVSYDEGESWKSLGVFAQGAKGDKGDKGDTGSDGAPGKNGENGKTPILKVEDGKLYVSYDENEESVLLIDFSEIVVNGTDGAIGKDGRGVESVKIEDGVLVVYYTDGSKETAGTIGENGGSDQTVDVYTDALDFYPLNGGTEYGVSVGKAIYLTKIVIPDTYNGRPVTTILKSGFCLDGFDSVLEEVVIPDSVTKICDSAFEGCSKITKINIPSSVTYIGCYAFYGVQSIQADISKSEAETREGWADFITNNLNITWKE